jgi:hypothetical protein
MMVKKKRRRKKNSRMCPDLFDNREIHLQDSFTALTCPNAQIFVISLI